MFLEKYACLSGLRKTKNLLVLIDLTRRTDFNPKTWKKIGPDNFFNLINTYAICHFVNDNTNVLKPSRESLTVT